MNVLTKSSSMILGPIAALLGYIMNGIFWLQAKIGLANIGLCIILFTIVIYMLLLPLTIRQQKFSKLTPLMNPELNAIRDKYKGKNDQASMQRMNEETQLVYAKYGVNPMGSCVQLIIQMPILFALYRVIMNVPAYVTLVKDVFVDLADALLTTSGAEEYLQSIASSIQATTISKEFTANTIIDTLYKFRPANWEALAEQFPDLSSLISTTQTEISRMNNFLGLDISDTPMNIIMAHKSVFLVIGAAMIPILSALSNWVVSKMAMAQSGGQEPQGSDQMAASMKTMNTMMPLMSAFFCLTLPVGMGIYWIAGAVVRGVQQYLINRHLDNSDLEAMLAANLEKNKQKMEKKGGVTRAQMAENARINTRQIDAAAESAKSRRKEIQKEAAAISGEVGKAKENVKPGSLAEKANMVSEYNKTHQKR